MRGLLAPCRTNKVMQFLVPILVRVWGHWKKGRYVERLLRSQAWLNGVIVPWSVCFTSSFLSLCARRESEGRTISIRIPFSVSFLPVKNHTHVSRIRGVLSKFGVPPHPFLSQPLRQIWTQAMPISKLFVSYQNLCSISIKIKDSYSFVFSFFYLIWMKPGISFVSSG